MTSRFAAKHPVSRADGPRAAADLVAHRERKCQTVVACIIRHRRISTGDAIPCLDWLREGDAKKELFFATPKQIDSARRGVDASVATPIFSHFHDWRASEIQSARRVVRVSLKWSGFALFVIRWSHSAARFPLVGICSGCQNGCDAKSIRGGRPSNQHTNTFLLSSSPSLSLSFMRLPLQLLPWNFTDQSNFSRASKDIPRPFCACLIYRGDVFIQAAHTHSSKRHFGMAGLKRGGER